MNLPTLLAIALLAGAMPRPRANEPQRNGPRDIEPPRHHFSNPVTSHGKNPRTPRARKTHHPKTPPKKRPTK